VPSRKPQEQRALWVNVARKRFGAQRQKQQDTPVAKARVTSHSQMQVQILPARKRRSLNSRAAKNSLLADLFPGARLPAVRSGQARKRTVWRGHVPGPCRQEKQQRFPEGAELKFEHRAPSGQWTLKNLASTQWWRTELLTCSETQVKPACPKRPRRFDRNPAGFSRAVVQLEQRTFTLGSNVPCEGSLGFNVTAQ
jgi:hypothetical protein